MKSIENATIVVLMLTFVGLLWLVVSQRNASPTDDRHALYHVYAELGAQRSQAYVQQLIADYLCRTGDATFCSESTP